MENNVKQMTLCGLMTCLLIVCAQLTIALPSLVPITLQTLAVYLIGLMLKPRYALLSTLCYILMGAIGLGVFAGMSGGIAVLAGPAGGFLFSFPIMAFVISLIAYKSESLVTWLIALLVGTLICYGIGTIYFIYVTRSALSAALMSCVIPFLPGDALKIIVALILNKKLKKFCTSK